MRADPDQQLRSLAEVGFDLAQTFDAQVAARAPHLDLLGGDERLGILIGNTRALWPPFTAAMRDPALAALDHPLEHYTESVIGAAFPEARIYYGHRRYDGAFLPFQKLAVAIGLGGMSEGGLVIHPIYGPWFALRAVVVLAGEPVTRAPIDKPCRCESGCREALTTALAARGPDGWRAWLAVRDSCNLNAHRYPDAQIRYHYTKVRDF